MNFHPEITMTTRSTAEPGSGCEPSPGDKPGKKVDTKKGLCDRAGLGQTGGHFEGDGSLFRSPIISLSIYTRAAELTASFSVDPN